MDAKTTSSGNGDNHSSWKSEMPPLAPGYHFIVSLCDVTCTQEQMSAIHEDLIQMVRTLIREYDLRTANGRFTRTRVYNLRTVPLLDEGEAGQPPEGGLETRQGEAGKV